MPTVHNQCVSLDLVGANSSLIFGAKYDLLKESPCNLYGSSCVTAAVSPSNASLLDFYNMTALRGTMGAGLRHQVGFGGRLGTVSAVLGNGLYDLVFPDGNTSASVRESSLDIVRCDSSCRTRPCSRIQFDPRVLCGKCDASFTCNPATLDQSSGSLVTPESISTSWASKLMVGVDAEHEGWEAVLQTSAASVCPIQTAWCANGGVPKGSTGPEHTWVATSNYNACVWFGHVLFACRQC